jgi:Cytochrome P460
MKWIVGLVVGAVAVAGVVASMVPASGQGGGDAAPVYGITIPEGYRDWKVISVAQIGPPINDVRIKLGNDVAIKAYRDRTLPFPDGTIIARLAYKQVASAEHNRALRAAAEQQGLPAEQIERLLAASSVAGPPTNVQFMVKNSKTYAATDGWAFAQFTDGKLDGETSHKTCFPCHTPGKERDFVFTRYSP